MYLAASPTGVLIPAVPTAQALCPSCQSPVQAKCGSVNIWHWAHHARTDCDTWAEPDSRWHHHWQALFPLDRVERPIRVGDTLHRADALTPTGTVIEFQHSALSVADIRAREDFYCDMLWVWDVQDADARERLTLRHKAPENYSTFQWSHARRSLLACRKPVYLHLQDDLFHVRKFHPGPPVRGWGHLVPFSSFCDAIIGGAR